MSYTAPRIRDHGTLVEMTSAFDASFVGTLAKIVTMAAVSLPLGSPGGNGGTSPGENVLEHVVGSPKGGTLNEQAHSVTPGVNTVSPGTTGSLGTAGSPGGVATPSTGSGGPGERLPFTGYWLMLSAAVGAGLASTGAAIRVLLRRFP